MDGQLQSLIDALDVATDERMIRAAMHSYCVGCGFERFAFLVTTAADISTVNNYPTEFQELYLANRYSRIDPVVSQAKREMRVFSWSSEKWPSRGISKEEKEFYARAMDHGIRAGTTIPVRGSYESTLLLTFATSQAKADISPLGDAARAQQAALIMHYQLRALSGTVHPQTQLRLSSREAMCLRWAAKGKRMHEIAILTNVQQRTVQHYLDNARRKLDAVNVTHAVSVAKDLGLI